MPAPLRVEWLGRQPYDAVLPRMLAQVDARLRGEVGDTLWLVEHEPVYTVGRHRGAGSNVRMPGDVPVVEVRRGGDVTFHGPGQLTGYPIVALPDGRHDVWAWLHGLEEVCDRTIAHWGIAGGRDERNTGVWVEGRKIAAIGVALRRWVSWHGFAINNTVDLEWFRRINPCGMDSGLVTRIEDHVDRAPRLEAVRDAAAAEFRRWWAEWGTEAAETGATG